MNRKRVYAIHFGRLAISSMTQYARWKAGPDSAPPPGLIFYRQDEAGRVTVRQYRADTPRRVDAFYGLTLRYPNEVDRNTGTLKVEPHRPKFQRWYAGINPHTGRAE